MAEWETNVADLSINDGETEQGAPLGDVSKVRANKFSAEEIASRGWNEPMKYDYARYNQERGANAAAPNEAVQELVAVQEVAEDHLISSEPEWASNSARYEWKDEYGEVGPKVPELEERLFRNQFLLRKGENFKALTLNVTQESEVQIRPIKAFEDAGIHPVMLENIKLCQYDQPTPIQAYCIPAILQNHDVIAIAQTGSGKTAAFLIPALSKLMGKAKKLAAPRPNPSADFDPRLHGVRAEPLVLVIVPTRELSVQIFDEARRLCYRSMLRPCVAYGGGPLREQLKELAKGCDILIGTPGRLIDLMSRGHALSFRRLRYTVIDEADELVGFDWQEDLNKIMSGGDNNEDADHRYLLFSATFPKEARKLAKEYLAVDHIRFTVGRLGSTHKNISQQIVNCEESLKKDCLIDLLMSLPPAKTMIFVNGKKSADFVDDFLFNSGLPSTSIHSDRTQREREDAIRAFKMGRAPLLVTTGVAARGLDFSNVMHVVNYDLPSIDHGGITEYLHRIGRTARMGHRGVATSFWNERNEDLAPMLVKILVECEQPIPEFLAHFKPDEGTTIDFEDASDDEDAEGSSGGDGRGAPAAANDGWGASAEGNGEWSSTTAPTDTWGTPAKDAGNSSGDSWGGNASADAWGSKGSKGKQPVANENEW